jgi:hypothetical protein
MVIHGPSGLGLYLLISQADSEYNVMLTLALFCVVSFALLEMSRGCHLMNSNYLPLSPKLVS